MMGVLVPSCTGFDGCLWYLYRVVAGRVLFVTQGFDGVHAGGGAGGVEAEDNSDADGDPECQG